ncbi:hypothetical protein [Mucilaginibacter sp. SG564]|uniref:hypothetical protein n=1 Tax=unclassified Mucilaginibacter TaxID=2617802 RepID=UPI0015520466|nr:hypothetical protein [Mucilaginibacter sp. SG564]NOW94185.1 hypothetical protein [Mucilaginibacter sp. SG564]
MTKEQIKAILLKYESGTCTKSEKALPKTWFLKQWVENLPTSDEVEDDRDAIGAALNKKVQPHICGLTLPCIVAVAPIILCLSFGRYFVLQKPVKAKCFRLTSTSNYSVLSSMSSFSEINAVK